MNVIDQLKAELCERYGVTPAQISFEIRLEGIEKEHALDIAKDYATPYSLIEGNCMAIGYGLNPGVWMYAFYKKEAEEDESHD